MSFVFCLLKVPGIIISATRIRAKATSVAAKCKACGCLKHVPCVGPFGGAVLPMRCDKNGQEAPEGGGEDCGAFSCAAVVRVYLFSIDRAN